jgi:hypothetical protein
MGGVHGWAVTGKWKFRQGLFGKQILSVEERRIATSPVMTAHSAANWREEFRWRDGNEFDLAWIFPRE